MSVRLPGQKLKTASGCFSARAGQARASTRSRPISAPEIWYCASRHGDRRSERINTEQRRSSLVAKGQHWIDARRSTSWEIACRNRRHTQQHDNAPIRDRIERTQSVERTAKHLRCGKCAGEARCESHGEGARVS